ncbi:MAG: hypothetical protein KME42_25520 [Tildeniella nuda ZEHNDER 1965/U140]|nr:hypothetical protein [Tildeniella nuda ZEHNDER 1965/U140]
MQRFQVKGVDSRFVVNHSNGNREPLTLRQSAHQQSMRDRLYVQAAYTTVMLQM